MIDPIVIYKGSQYVFMSLHLSKLKRELCELCNNNFDKNLQSAEYRELPSYVGKRKDNSLPYELETMNLHCEFLTSTLKQCLRTQSANF